MARCPAQQRTFNEIQVFGPYGVGRFRNFDELRTALHEFRQRYNHQWIVERLDYEAPVKARLRFGHVALAAAA
jgi:transposase InsO family protein